MYPTLQSSQESRKVLDSFGGYNHNVKIGDGEFYDDLNLTADISPVLSVRKGRGVYLNDGNVTGMISKDALCYTDGQYFCMNQYRVDMGLNDEPKQLISMGAYVIILPDKKYINTANMTEYGNIEASFTSSGPVIFSLCKQDGTLLTPDYIQATEPEEPPTGAIWMDTSTTPHGLKMWSQGTGLWTNVLTTFVKIQCAGIGKAFSEYDGVKLSIPKGLEVSTASQIEALDGAAIIYARDDDSITVVGILDEQTTIEGEISVSRTMPEMDFITESSNRLWGCRYGLSADGNVVNELYACKLGDFKNWNCFMGISTDSYTVSLGSDGRFTGAVTHAGYPIFFKENCMHKVYGNYPSNFQVQTTACRGVQRGCSKSIAIVNEILYYKGQHGICAYDGSLPSEVSSALGDVAYYNAVAGGIGNKYYVCMEDASGEKHIFCLDTAKGIWHKESGAEAVQFCASQNELYCCTSDGKIITMLGSNSVGERVVWMAQTGIINASLPERTYLKRLNIRMMLEQGGSCTIKAQYDSCGEWEILGQITGENLRSFTLPVMPCRCDHLRLRLEGAGNAMFFSIAKTFTEGSDKP